ncbi:helix-turn-helix domain-containing protein [Mycobacteroides abscessus]|uniref:helix-turn-helix domain-containing protein n=1 Tax=Mycobacteroides abscessus TaxID=36809 RepID=UPI001878F857|nr:hypothetical protein [Mycobacteroides abscessus]
MTNPTQNHRRWATLDEAAAIVGVHPRTMRRRVADGSIQGYRLAGSRFIRVDMNEVETALFQPIPAVGRGNRRRGKVS